MRKHTEDDLQRKIFQWITLATPRIPQLALAFHPANGGYRNAREAARLKGMGVRAGVPDIMIPGHDMHRQCIGLAIELKSDKGRLTTAQEGWRDRLMDAGWGWHLCRDFDTARLLIASYFGAKP